MPTPTARLLTQRLRCRLLLAACAASVLLAAGCSRDDDDTGAARTGGRVEALPQPLPAAGAVTGMPEHPGPGEVPLGGEPPPPPLFAADERFGMPLLEDNPETGLGSALIDADLPEPTPADAVALLRQYYAALTAREHARAYGMWSDGGRASGLTPEQFAASFAQVAALDAQLGQPRPLAAAAGAGVVEVPLVLRTTHGDGSVRTQAGRVVLRRALADAGGDGQRAWRIASSDLRDTLQ